MQLLKKIQIFTEVQVFERLTATTKVLSRAGRNTASVFCMLIINCMQAQGADILVSCQVGVKSGVP